MRVLAFRKRLIKYMEERRWSSGRVKDIFTPFFIGFRENSDQKNSVRQ